MMHEIDGFGHYSALYITTNEHNVSEICGDEIDSITKGYKLYFIIELASRLMVVSSS